MHDDLCVCRPCLAAACLNLSKMHGALCQCRECWTAFYTFREAKTPLPQEKVGNPIITLQGLIKSLVTKKQEETNGIKCSETTHINRNNEIVYGGCLMESDVILGQLLPNSIMIGSQVWNNRKGNDVDIIVAHEDLAVLLPYLRSHYKNANVRSYLPSEDNVTAYTLGSCPNSHIQLQPLDIILPLPNESPTECFKRMFERGGAFLHEGVYLTSQPQSDPVGIVPGALRAYRNYHLIMLPTATDRRIKKTLSTVLGSRKHTPWTFVQPYEYPQEEETEVIYAWKEFEIDNLCLVGGYQQKWLHGTMDARCGKHFSMSQYNETAPLSDLLEDHAECTCGIYSYKNRLPKKYETYCFKASALCVIWGTVIEHTEGYKSEHCRIERLFIPAYMTVNGYTTADIKHELSSRYNCEVVIEGD